MKHLLYELNEPNKKYPAFLLVHREDDEVTLTVRSPQRPSKVEGILMAGNTGCVALNSKAIMHLIVVLGDLLPHANNLKTLAPPELPCPPTDWK
jgi:hypothetical protein